MNLENYFQNFKTIVFSHKFNRLSKIIKNQLISWSAYTKATRPTQKCNYYLVTDLKIFCPHSLKTLNSENESMDSITEVWTHFTKTGWPPTGKSWRLWLVFWIGKKPVIICRFCIFTGNFQFTFTAIVHDDNDVSLTPGDDDDDHTVAGYVNYFAVIVEDSDDVSVTAWILRTML